MTAGMARYTGKAAEDNLEEHRASFLSYCQAEINIDKEVKEKTMEVYGSFPENIVMGDEYERNLHGYCKHRQLFKTKGGRFGLGPSCMQPREICCVLCGACVPFILRRCLFIYKFAGEYHIHGVMRGEVVRRVLGSQRMANDIIIV